MPKHKKWIDIETLSKEEIDNLSIQLGEQIRNFCDKAVLKANKILKKYGMECKMAFQIDRLGSFPEKFIDQENSNLISIQTTNPKE